MSENKAYRTVIHNPRVYFSKCRENKNLTQKDLAELLRVTETTIRNVEKGRGNPVQDFMVRAAIFFNADVFELFPESPLLKHLKKKQSKVTST